MLYNAHSSTFSGHLGHNKTVERITSKYYWPRYTKAITESIKSCEICQKSKYLNHDNDIDLIPIISNYPFEIVTADVLGPVPESKNGNKLLLVIIDHFSSYIEMYPLKNQVAEEVARCFIDFISRHGIMSTVLTDQGKNFEAEVLHEVWELLDVRVTHSTAAHQRCDGKTERFNKTIISMIKCYVSENQPDWDEKLPQLAFA